MCTNNAREIKRERERGGGGTPRHDGFAFMSFMDTDSESECAHPAYVVKPIYTGVLCAMKREERREDHKNDEERKRKMEGGGGGSSRSMRQKQRQE